MPAPPDIYVNQSTSLIQVDTSQLVADQSAVVLLSSITSPGLLVTIRDFTGNASANKNIVVSTTQGLHFFDNVNKFSYTINQPYGFLTVTPKTPQTWAVLNTFAFPDKSSSAIIENITATTILVSSLYGSSIQTNYGSAVNMSVFSSMYTNSLTIGSTLTVQDFAYFARGISTIGSAAFFSSVQIQGVLSVFSSVALASSLFVTGDIRVNGDLVPSNSNLISTVQGLGTAQYVSTTSLTSTVQGLGTAQYVSTNSLISTIQGLGTANYVSTTYLGNALMSTVQGLGTVQYVSSSSLTSTVQGLGTALYVSTTYLGNSLMSTVQGLGTSQYVSSSSLTSTVQGLGTVNYVSTTYLGNALMSTVQGLGTVQYVSSSSLTSTVQGLGTAGYMSTAAVTGGLISTVQGLGTSQYVSSSSLTSTVQGLGTANYVSTTYLGNALISTVQGLGTAKYVSTTYLGNALMSTVQGLGTAKYVSTTYLGNALMSTVQGLGSSQYVSTQSLTSTVQGLGSALYVSTTYLGNSLMSTVQGLGTAQYVSSSSLTSTVQGLGTALYVSTTYLGNALISTVQGLGTAQYVSSSSLTSTVQGLGTANYVSTTYLGNFLRSTVQGLGTSQYISSTSLTSTVRGLGLAGYVSTFNNVSSISSQRFIASSIGIGCNFPRYQLDVNGEINASQNIYVNGNAVLTSGAGGAGVTTDNLMSTVRGLGTSQYVSTNSLTSTVRGLGLVGYLSSFSNVSSISSQRFVASSVGVNCNFPRYEIDVNGEINASQNIYVNGNAVLTSGGGGVSTDNLTSTVRGLGLSGYVSTFNNVSSISSQRIVASSIGIACNTASYTLDVNGQVNVSGKPRLSTWVAVGSNTTAGSAIKYSITNGMTWQTVTGGFSGYGSGAAWNGYQWVAVGFDTTGTSNTIFHSLNGTSWSPASTDAPSLPFTNFGNGIAWGNSLWIAVGQYLPNCSILRSSDGVNWLRDATGTFTERGNAIAWNGYQWMAVGSNSPGDANTIKYSINGLTWTNATSGGFSGQGKGVAWNGFMWVAVGSNSPVDTNNIKYSYDGLVWINGTNGFLTQGTAVAWNGNMWVATGTGGTNTTNIKYSYNGINWSNTTGGFPGGAFSVAWNGNRWIAGGSDSSSPNTVTKYSPDGITWFETGNTSGFTASTMGVAYSQTLTPDITMCNLNFYTQSQPTYLTSSHQILTTSASLIIDNLLYINNTSNSIGVLNPNPVRTLDIGATLETTQAETTVRYVALITKNDLTDPNFKNIIYTKDGSNWLSNTTGGWTAAAGNKVVWGGNKWVACGPNQQPNVTSIIYSSDGITWNNCTNTFSIEANSCAYGQDNSGYYRWVAVGKDTDPLNNIKYSNNGINWTNAYSAGSAWYSISANDVVWNGRIWVAVGVNTLPTLNYHLYSSNGAYWYYNPNSFFDANADYGGLCVAASSNAGGLIVAGGYSAINGKSLQYTADPATAWSASISGSFYYAGEGTGRSIAFNGSRWIALGSDGNTGVTKIKYSDDGKNWSNSITPTTLLGTCVTWGGNRWMITSEGTIVGAGRTGMLNLFYSYDGINWYNDMTGPSIKNAYAVGARDLPQNTSYNLGNISMNVNGSITQDNVGLPPVGSIIMFAGPNPPIKWIICDGKSLNTTTFSPLFSVIGYLYGGSGANFNVPDLGGRVPVGSSSNYGLTQTGGEETHTLTIPEIPPHSHTQSVNPGVNIPAGNGGSYALWSGFTSQTSQTGGDASGNTVPHNNMQPYIVLNYIIRAFP